MSAAPEPREPAVAGTFYPADAKRLAAFVAAEDQPDGRSAAPAAPEHGRALGALCPHAGYPFSGTLARAVIRRAAPREHVLVAGPNHTGLGAPRSLHPGGRWRFPGFEVAIDGGLTGDLARRDVGLQLDTAAHTREHAVEVIVPFVHHEAPAARLTALTLAAMTADDCVALGEAIADAVTAAGLAETFTFVASSDMTHFEPAERAAEQDAHVWPHLRALDADGLYRTVREHRISMCGYIPTAVMLACVRRLGATEAREVGYTHSGAVTGDDTNVVAYAGWTFH